MLRIILLALALLTLAGIAIALVLAAVVFLICAVLVVVPTYLMYRHWSRRNDVPAGRRNPVDSLQTLYVEGKIDLFEFENRVAHLVAVEH